MIILENLVLENPALERKLVLFLVMYYAPNKSNLNVCIIVEPFGFFNMLFLGLKSQFWHLKNVRGMDSLNTSDISWLLEANNKSEWM